MIVFSFIVKNLRLVVYGAALLLACYVFYIITDRVILQQEIKGFKATEAQNNERNETNQTVNNSSDARKCKLIGGVFTNGSCI
jgi:cell division protein FtsL